MGQQKYVHIFVPSGKPPEAQPHAGTTRSVVITNAKEAVERTGHTQDIYRMPVADAQGHTPSAKPLEWEFVNTVGKKPASQISKEHATVNDCIRAIEASCPTDLAVERAPVVKWRREGMLEAISAIKRHFSLK